MLAAFPGTASHCSTVADRPQNAAGSRTNILRSTTKGTRLGMHNLQGTTRRLAAGRGRRLDYRLADDSRPRRHHVA